MTAIHILVGMHVDYHCPQFHFIYNYHHGHSDCHIVVSSLHKFTSDGFAGLYLQPGMRAGAVLSNLQLHLFVLIYSSC